LKHVYIKEVATMMWNSNWDGWGGALVMLLMMLVFWGGLIWLIIYGVRRFSPEGREVAAPTAIEQLEGRFARGEIDRDDFEERRRVLRSTAAEPKEVANHS